MLKRRRQLLLLIVIVALALRCWRLNDSFLTTDESFSWRVTTYSTWDMVVRVADDVHGPLYFLFLKAAVALCGSSLWVLRGLSVLFGVAIVPMMYLLVREALAFRRRAVHQDVSRPFHAAAENRRHDAQGSKQGSAGDWAALFSATLVACAPLQVAAARNARMYSLGGFLAVSTAWLLLRALRAERPRRGWLLYGLAAAAYCYTHHFALFTVFAQVLFAVGYAIVQAIRLRGPVRRTSGGTAWGMTLAFAMTIALYSPWLPVLIWQARQVHQQFWIAPFTVTEATHVFFTWSAGFRETSSAACMAWAVMWALVAGYAVFRARAVAWFFLIQAVVPWVLCIGIFVLGGRSILQERYLTFAQLSLFALWGVTLTVLPGRLARAGWAALVVIGAVVGMLGQGGLFPAAPHAGELAVRHLANEYRQGDLILVSRPAEVNRTRYYAHRLGIEPIDVRCYQSVFPQAGHRVHIAALNSRDIIWSQDAAIAAERVWTLAEGDNAGQWLAPTDFQRTAEQRFAGSGGSRATLTLYSRRK